MRPRGRSLLVLFLAGPVWLSSGCPAAPKSEVDGSPPDSEPGVSEAGLAICFTPGDYCTPADPCGLNPVCNDEHRCVTTGRRDCDDGIACTEDRCVFGGCDHVVEAGHCLIEATCFTKGQTMGCGYCDPAVSETEWAPLDGVPCDDNNPCTKGDECQQGVCVGQVYNCSDHQTCTSDSCDGKGGCSHTLKSNYCQIEKTCYQHLQTDDSGCKICDVAVSQFAWQERSNVCNIDNKCYGAAAKDDTGCFFCDPDHAPNTWSPLADRCLIGPLCVTKGAIHPSGCAICDPDQTSKQWTPIPGAALSVTTFESGLSDFATSALVDGVGWQLSQARSTSSPQSLYYGNLITLDFDNGQPNKGTASSKAIQLAGGQKAYLSFQLYIDTEKTNNFDVLTVLVNNTPLWIKSTSTLPTNQYETWTQITVDLTAYAGQTVTITFDFDTKDALNNKFEGVYIDDVTLLTGCGNTP